MRISAIMTELLGPRLAADTGEPGTFAWSEHLLGAPGYRIAGGTEEIQRTSSPSGCSAFPASRALLPQPPDCTFRRRAGQAGRAGQMRTAGRR